MAQNRDPIEQAKLIMGQMLRMKPKPHDEMKLGKPRGKRKKSPRKRKKGDAAD